MTALALAIRNQTETLATAQLSYKENVYTVNAMMTGVLSTRLPTLNTNPPDWNEFVEAYRKANQGALNWANTVMARLLTVPSNIIGYNNSITQALSKSKNYAQKLQADPNNELYRNALKDNLDVITDTLSLVTTFISGAVTAIQNSSEDLPVMAQSLKEIATRSSVDAKADQKKIDELNAQIATLKSDIKSLTAAIVALGIADAAALTLGVVATIAAWPVGALVWFMLGPAVAVASTYIGLDAAKIKADKAAIDQKLGEIKGITADVATLQLLANNFSELADQAQAVQENLQAVLAEWQALQSSVSTAITDIQTALSDSGNANYGAVLNDLNAAINDWTAAFEKAGSLQLNLEVNDAPLQLGMSSEQVSAAMKQGSTIGLIAYYNQQAATLAKVA